MIMNIKIVNYMIVEICFGRIFMIIDGVPIVFDQDIKHILVSIPKVVIMLVNGRINMYQLFAINIIAAGHQVD